MGGQNFPLRITLCWGGYFISKNSKEQLVSTAKKFSGRCAMYLYSALWQRKEFRIGKMWKILDRMIGISLYLSSWLDIGPQCSKQRINHKRRRNGNARSVNRLLGNRFTSLGIKFTLFYQAVQARPLNNFSFSKNSFSTSEPFTFTRFAL